MPPMTLPHMIPTSGTITASLNWMRWMNQTKIQVPRIAAAKAKSARVHKVDDGMNSSASRMPSWAEEMVAPVVGDTNLLLHSCCIMSPATLIPTPVQRIASRRGRRDTKKISHKCRFPDRSSCSGSSITPIKSEITDATSSRTTSNTVERYCLIVLPPLISFN